MDLLRSDLPLQPSLPGFGAPEDLFDVDPVEAPAGRGTAYQLFFAIFPEPEDAHRIASLVSELRARHGLRGSPLSPERLHVTLQSVAAYRTPAVPQVVVDAACAAARGVDGAALPIVFDRAMSFATSKAFVLRSDAVSDSGIARLRHALGRALRSAGLRPPPAATPHMTMLYDPSLVPEHGIEPLRWTATRYALILSHVGATHHQWVAQWPLRRVR